MNTCCPYCKAKFKAPDEYAGRKTKCPKCKEGFILQEPGWQSGMNGLAKEGAAQKEEISITGSTAQEDSYSHIFVGSRVSEKHLEKAKNEIVYKGERIQAIVSGRVKEKATKTKGRHSFFDLDSDKGGSILKNYLIVTDSRVILWARGVLNSSVDAFDYVDIKSVEMQKGILFGSIVFNVYGKMEHFAEMQKPEASRIVDMIRNNIKTVKNKIYEAKKPIEDKAEIDVIGQIERLASLKDRGILSAEEFVSKKQKLLEQL